MGALRFKFQREFPRTSLVTLGPPHSLPGCGWTPKRESCPKGVAGQSKRGQEHLAGAHAGAQGLRGEVPRICELQSRVSAVTPTCEPPQLALLPHTVPPPLLPAGGQEAMRD